MAAQAATAAERVLSHFSKWQPAYLSGAAVIGIFSAFGQFCYNLGAAGREQEVNVLKEKLVHEKEKRVGAEEKLVHEKERRVGAEKKLEGEKEKRASLQADLVYAQGKAAIADVFSQFSKRHDPQSIAKTMEPSE
eukprot:tig00000157_g9699.t1